MVSVRLRVQQSKIKMPISGSLLSLIWHPTHDLMAYVLYGEGYNPAFGPVWSFNNRTSGLEPETTRTYEIGLKKIWGPDDNQLAVEVAGYIMTRHDLLVIVPGQGAGRQANAGRQRSVGLEGKFAWQAEKLIKGTKIYGNLNLVDSEWQDFDFYDPYIFKWYSFSDNKVAGVPSFSSKIGWEQSFPRYSLTFRAEYQYYGDYWYDNANTVKNGKYGLLNSSLTWAPAWLPRTHFSLTATNLLNKDYWYAYGDANGPLAAAPWSTFRDYGQVKTKMVGSTPTI